MRMPKVGPANELSGGVAYPYEDYYVAGPNPAPGLHAGQRYSDVRLHAPIAGTESQWGLYDEANTAVQRAPHRPFPVEPYPPVVQPYSVPPGLTAPVALMQRGWVQQYIPFIEATRSIPGPSFTVHSPILELSQPITYDIQGAKKVSTIQHAPIKGKAPKPH